MEEKIEFQSNGPEAKLAWLFRDIGHLSKNHLNEGLQSLGLYWGQPMILQIIHDQPGSTQKEIADSLHISGASLSASISKLQKANFVEQVQSSEDRRRNTLYLTKAGEEVRRKCRQNLLGLYHSFLESMNEEEEDELIRLLTSIRERLSSEEDETKTCFCKPEEPEDPNAPEKVEKPDEHNEPEELNTSTKK